MAAVRIILALGLGLALTGCQLPALPRLFFAPDTWVKPLADGYFHVELDPAKISKLWGPRSSTLASHVDEEVAKSGLCKNGHRLVSEWWGRGNYVVKGQCK